MPPIAPSNLVIVAELIMPGFTADLSTWACRIDQSGALCQEVNVANALNHFRGERQRFTAQLEEHAVREILGAASEDGFARLSDRYSADETDLPTTALAFRIGPELKRVEAYGAGALAWAGSQEMKLFTHLWRRVERHLPYGGDD